MTTKFVLLILTNKEITSKKNYIVQIELLN